MHFSNKIRNCSEMCRSSTLQSTHHICIYMDSSRHRFRFSLPCIWFTFTCRTENGREWSWWSFISHYVIKCINAFAGLKSVGPNGMSTTPIRTRLNCTHTQNPFILHNYMQLIARSPCWRASSIHHAVEATVSSVTTPQQQTTITTLTQPINRYVYNF